MLRERRAIRPLPCAQAARAPACAARGLGPRAPAPGPDRALLRLVGARHLRLRLRSARRRRGGAGSRAGFPGRLPRMSTGRERGALAIVLHTHMPYVEGFGTWPFGEEWLWEAIVGSYVPLLGLLDRDLPLTLSLTPVLCDQLEAPGLFERFQTFVREVRRGTHERDAAGLRAAGEDLLARELERSWRDYEGALETLADHGRDLLGALGRHVQWTSAATHAVLPLLATDAGAGLQVRSGVRAHRARFARGWRGGFWLPECAYASWLEPILREAGARAVCVEMTARLGLGAREHLRAYVGDSGVVLVPVDRATMSLVWSERGYPASGHYRDYHHHTVHHHTPWSNDGGV